ncbi:hypothetical protein CFP56_039239 [Quercus suber]|uniref:Transposase-associated domain-containing protein n=1 Tax=Quercus suber TaxID=58331 RepID=A0AAW0J072_QUESU
MKLLVLLHIVRLDIVCKSFAEEAVKSVVFVPIRSCTEYINGVENFLEYAFKHSIDGDMKINYPHIDCSNKYRRTQDEVQYHLLFRIIRRDYTTWYLHGEGDSEEEGDSEMEGDDDDGMLYGDFTTFHPSRTICFDG